MMSRKGEKTLGGMIMKAHSVPETKQKQLSALFLNCFLAAVAQ
jgi:hypothetical protein